MKTAKNEIDIFTYLDYRDFLRDWYEGAKKSRASFSFRTFSKRAGFTSPNFFKLVMDGDRNLTEESLGKFSAGLNLNKQEQEFFRNLVFFTQAKTHEQKDYYYRQIVASKKFKALKPIESHQYEFYSAWYHPVIRELAVSKDFDGTPEWLTGRIFPAITPYQAKRSLELLEKMGFIKKISGKQWKQSNPLVSTGPESSSLTLLNYHQNLLELTRELLPKIPPSERDVSALTLGVARKRIPEIKKRIQEFRRDIMRLVSDDDHPEDVVLLAVQLFPVTKHSMEKSPS